MELRQEIKQRLRTARSWPGLIEELEREVEQVEPKEQQGRPAVRAGRALRGSVPAQRPRDGPLPGGVQALAAGRARARARARRSIARWGTSRWWRRCSASSCKVTQDRGAQRATSRASWGIALLDLGKRDQALPHLEAAAQARPDDRELADALAAANYDREDWLGEVERLQKQAEKSDSSLAARIYLRIARIYRLEGITDDGVHRGAAARSWPTSRRTSRPTSCSRARSARPSASTRSSELHEKRAYACADEREQADLYRRFASMWALRWNDVERSAHFYRQALETYYGDGAAPGRAVPRPPGGVRLPARDRRAPRASGRSCWRSPISACARSSPTTSWRSWPRRRR